MLTISPTSDPNFKKGKIIFLSLGHLINDSYHGFLSPLLPLLMVKLNLSLTLAGTLASIMSIFSSLTQPVYGYLADRLARRFFVYLGPLISALFMSFIGLAPSYGTLIVVVALSGIGVAAFHPLAATMVHSVSGERKGLGMSIFVTSGNSGYAIGPLIIVPVVTALGLKSTWLTVLPGLVISYLLFKYAPPAPRRNPKKRALKKKVFPWYKLQHLLILCFIVLIRAFVILGFTTFVPIHLKSQGYSLFTAGSTVTLFVLMGSTGALLGGPISDRWGRKQIIIFSLLGSAPLLFAFLNSSGVLAFIFLAASAMVLFSSMPVLVIMAQELAPGRASTVSALMMGFAWGVAGLLLTPLGFIADIIGIIKALNYLSGVPFIAFVAALALPNHKKREQRNKMAMK